MHYLNESHILLFLIQLVLLLAIARTFGVMCQAIRVPALAGEMLTGVLLGPTILGRISPALQTSLFPVDAVQNAMLETVSWLGVFFLLLSVGFEVKISRAVFVHGRGALLVGIVGVIVPVAIGFPLFWFVDPAYWGPNATQVSFALFLAVAGSITAISVVARVVRDLDIVKSDIGTLILSACAVNDLFGWVLFSFAVALATGTSVDSSGSFFVLFGAAAFAVFSLTVGGFLLRHAARAVRTSGLRETPALLSLVTSVGLVCGIVTHLLGIHAILGFFLAGVMVGSVDEISFAQREALSDTMHALFVPIFFATIGIKIDFFAQIDLTITALFTLVAIGGKLGGAWIGARLARLPNSAAILVGLAFVPGGAMEIVVGILALEIGLIPQVTFVGIVFAALLSSILVGPLMSWWFRRNPELVASSD